MELPFTHRPGRRERHLRRRHGNVLFAWPALEVEPLDLLDAQRLDHEDLETFQGTFRTLVERAMALPPDADSDAVLALKQDLERAYEDSHALPQDLTRERAALARLIGLIMTAVERAAGADPLAHQELAEEAQARAIHFRLLEQPLVADLLHPQAAITPQDLAPSVLSASEAEVDGVLALFDPIQLAELAEVCAALLVAREAVGLELPVARERLGRLLAGLSSAVHPRH